MTHTQNLTWTTGSSSPIS